MEPRGTEATSQTDPFLGLGADPFSTQTPLESKKSRGYLDFGYYFFHLYDFRNQLVKAFLSKN